DVDGSGRINRHRGPVGVHRCPAYRLVRRERRASRRHRADADAETAVAVIEDGRLDHGPVQLVVVELPEAGKGPAAGERTVIVDSGRTAGIAAVVRDEHLVPAVAPLERVGREIDLVRLRTREPRSVAVVTIGRSAVPGLSPVD